MKAKRDIENFINKGIDEYYSNIESEKATRKAEEQTLKWVDEQIKNQDRMAKNYVIGYLKENPQEECKGCKEECGLAGTARECFYVGLELVSHNSELDDNQIFEMKKIKKFHEYHPDFFS